MIDRINLLSTARWGHFPFLVENTRSRHAYLPVSFKHIAHATQRRGFPTTGSGPRGRPCSAPFRTTRNAERNRTPPGSSQHANLIVHGTPSLRTTVTTTFA